MADSEAERQVLGVACGVAINQSAETDLVSNASSGEPFGDDADHDPEHGSPAVEEFLAWLHGLIWRVVTNCKPIDSNCRFFDLYPLITSRSPGVGSIQWLLSGSVAPVLATDPCICRRPLRAPLKRTSPPEVLASTVEGWKRSTS